MKITLQSPTASHRASAWLACFFVCHVAVTAQQPAPETATTDSHAAAAIAAREVETTLRLQPTTRSESQQFTIVGGEDAARSSLAFLAEELKADFHKMTGEKDDWKIPITLTLHGNIGEPSPPRRIVTRIDQSETGFLIRLDIHLARGLERERLREQLIAALIYERSLKSLPAGNLDQALLVKPWLTVGLCEAIAMRQQEIDRRLYQAVFRSGGIFAMDDLFSFSAAQMEDCDSASRTAFRVSAGALVAALLEQPDGSELLRHFLDDIALFDGDTTILLRKHFPAMSISPTSLEKWWALQLAVTGRDPIVEVMSISQTERALEEALRFQNRDDKGQIATRGIIDWRELAGKSENERRQCLVQTEEALVRLSYRCFPSYRPLLLAYQQQLQHIVKNHSTDIDATLKELQERRTRMLERNKRARDYLDWFEITRARDTSGVFSDYMELKKRLEQGTLRHKDHLSDYVDKAQAIYER